MKFIVSAELDYTAAEPCILILNVHAAGFGQQIIEEKFIISQGFGFNEVPSFPDKNRLARIQVEQAGNVHCSYRAVVDNEFTIVDFDNLPNSNLFKVGPEILRYLNPSRYCQADKLVRLATHQFGRFDSDLEKVLAITEWIYTNVEYLSGSTTGETSAYDTVTQQAGVCRDFAHLGIALCRALTIPARYCAVYAYQLIPQDFHACFEAYIAGHWVMFDATRLVPLNALVRIASGQDAAETAFANYFGNLESNFITVDSQLADAGFQPMYHTPKRLQGICYA